jgi:hypothetical protein
MTVLDLITESLRTFAVNIKMPGGFGFEAVCSGRS